MRLHSSLPCKVELKVHGRGHHSPFVTIRPGFENDVDPKWWAEWAAENVGSLLLTGLTPHEAPEQQSRDGRESAQLADGEA
jgi:hypothetical protein